MEYYNNILCIPTRELLEVMSESNYKQLAARGKLEVARRACRGRCALVVFDSLPDKYRAAARERYPQGGIMQLQKWFRDNYTLDAEARSFFSRFRFDNGDPTNLEQFHLPKMHAFYGMLTAIVQTDEMAGEIILTAKASGVKAGTVRLQAK